MLACRSKHLRTQAEGKELPEAHQAISGAVPSAGELRSSLRLTSSGVSPGKHAWSQRFSRTRVKILTLPAGRQPSCRPLHSLLVITAGLEIRVPHCCRTMPCLPLYWRTAPL